MVRGSTKLDSRSHCTNPSNKIRSTRGLDNPVDRKSTRLNSSHGYISYAVFCLKKKISNYCRDYLLSPIACPAPPAPHYDPHIGAVQHLQDFLFPLFLRLPSSFRRVGTRQPSG